MTEPLVSVEVDLRDFAFMPLDVVRLRDSELAATVTGEEFRAAVLLWCASWHQIPAGSLPDDDAQLSSLAGYGRVVKEWLRHKAGALHGWVKCSDGRIYHPTIAEKANDAWESKLRQRWRTECARIRKNNERHKRNDHIPEFEEWLSNGCRMRQADIVAYDSEQMSQGQTCETASKGELRDRDRDINNISLLRSDDASAQIPEKPKARKWREAFAEWYEAYPHKVGKAAAEKAFEKIVRAGNVTQAELMDGLANYKRSKPANREWCNPATWLNQARWLDAPAMAPIPGQSKVLLSPTDPPPWRMMLKLYCGGTAWAWTNASPEPGDPGCKIPQEILDEFRDQLPRRRFAEPTDPTFAEMREII